MAVLATSESGPGEAGATANQAGGRGEESEEENCR